MFNLFLHNYKKLVFLGLLEISKIIENEEWEEKWEK